ncbi:MAG: DUF115 domain-containing protein [Treponema sp.]|jgi:hypothetical protein|nr:DUF115 domain-containing protein [Treponema sp.]
MPETAIRETVKKENCGASRLHSRFNPRLEAERYLDALSIRDGIMYFILIEPGRGYLASILAERYPGAKIISLHVEEPEIEEPAAPGREMPSWSPLRGPLMDFLEREIPDIPAHRITIVEWRPALAAYGRDYLALVAETSEFIKRIDAGARTLRAFGGKWIRNFFRNLSIPFTFLAAPSLSAPVLVTCSGPGLEGALPRITRMKEDGCFILAVSSSVMALRARGLVPDMVISTDGGNWALLHLYECFRLNRGPAPNLAAGLCAALPSQCSALPFLAIDDGSLWQRVVFSGLGIPSISLAQRGTVAASALDLAFRFYAEEVFIAGADLRVRDIHTHARPYGFDRLVSEEASRFTPAYSRSFERALAVRDGGSHGVYAAWFKNRLAAYPGHVISLGDNNPLFGADGGEELPRGQGRRKPERAAQTPERSPRQADAKIFSPETFPEGIVAAPFRARRGAEILAGALAEKEVSGILRRELHPLLFPEKQSGEADLSELQDAVYALTPRTTGNRRGR